MSDRSRRTPPHRTGRQTNGSIGRERGRSARTRGAGACNRGLCGGLGQRFARGSIGLDVRREHRGAHTSEGGRRWRESGRPLVGLAMGQSVAPGPRAVQESTEFRIETRKSARGGPWRGGRWCAPGPAARRPALVRLRISEPEGLRRVARGSGAGAKIAADGPGRGTRSGGARPVGNTLLGPGSGARPGAKRSLAGRPAARPEGLRAGRPALVRCDRAAGRTVACRARRLPPRGYGCPSLKA